MSETQRTPMTEAMYYGIEPVEEIIELVLDKAENR